MAEVFHQIPWEALDLLVKLTESDKDDMYDYSKRLRDNYPCTLKIVGKRYYLVFATADDYIFFKLKYL